jgi:hypothetical protein
MKCTFFKNFVSVTYKFRVFPPLLEASRQINLVESSKVIGENRLTLTCEKLLFAMQQKLLLSLGLVKLTYLMVEVVICTNDLIRMLLQGGFN